MKKLDGEVDGKGKLTLEKEGYCEKYSQSGVVDEEVNLQGRKVS